MKLKLDDIKREYPCCYEKVEKYMRENGLEEIDIKEFIKIVSKDLDLKGVDNKECLDCY